jgi:hypothetical protein
MRKAVAIAALGAVIGYSSGADAMAVLEGPNGSLSIYGFLYPEVDFSSGSGGATAGSFVSALGSNTAHGTVLKKNNPAFVNKTSLLFSDSYLGIRGDRKIGNVTALFQIESKIGEDNGGTTNTLGTRNTFVGLRNNYGEIRLGNMDTVYKNLGDNLYILDITSGNFMSSSNVFAKAGFGGQSASSSFHLRRANTIRFDTGLCTSVPSEQAQTGFCRNRVMGFGLHLSYSPDDNKTAGLNQRLASNGIDWKRGPWFASAVQEIHWDFMPFSSGNTPNSAANPTAIAGVPAMGHSRDVANKVSVGYFGKKFRTEVSFARIKYTEGNTATSTSASLFSSYVNNRATIAMEYDVTPTITLAADYAYAAAGSCTLTHGSCSTSGLQGSQYTLAARYRIDPSTAVFIAASELVNGSSASYSTIQTPTTPGQRIKNLAVGVIYKF